MQQSDLFSNTCVLITMFLLTLKTLRQVLVFKFVSIRSCTVGQLHFTKTWNIPWKMQAHVHHATGMRRKHLYFYVQVEPDRISSQTKTTHDATQYHKLKKLLTICTAVFTFHAHLLQLWWQPSVTKFHKLFNS